MNETINNPENSTDQPAPTLISPDQTEMFSESVQQGSIAETSDATRMDISSLPAENAQIPVLEIPVQTVVENVQEAAMTASPVTTAEDEKVSGGTKVKILAALAIVAVAGYVAYWVQEPLQIKADVIAEQPAQKTSGPVTPADTTLSDTDTVETAETAVQDNMVAAAEDTGSTTGSAPAVTDGQSVSVDVSLFGFEPATVTIDKGTTVIWTNTSTEDQTIIGSSTDGESFVSDVLTSGTSYSYKFEQDGSFEYYSTYNPALKGSIVVGKGVADPAAPAVTTSTTETSDTAADNTNEPVLTSASTQPENVLESAIDETAAVKEENTSTESVKEAQTEELKPAADAPKKLAKTGPAETLYVVMLLGIAWINRRKLQKAFQSVR